MNLSAGLDYYAELLVGTQSTTNVTFAGAGTVLGVPNANQSNAQLRFATDGTGQSALASSITPSGATAANTPLTFWFGLR